LRAPLMRSPSQWPGTVRVATSAGRSAMGVIWGIWPRRSIRPTRRVRLTQRRQQLAPQGSAGQHIEPHIDRLGREMFTHVVRIRALETSGNLFRRAALNQLCLDILPQQGSRSMRGRRGWRGLGWPRPSAPYRPGRVGSAQRCGPPRGSWCRGLASTPAPSSVTTDPEPGLGAGSHDLCHSSACNIVWPWQHRSPSTRWMRMRA
jgi:hypothetical protein